MKTLSSKLKSAGASKGKKTRPINESVSRSDAQKLKQIYDLIDELKRADLKDHLATNMYNLAEVLYDEDFEEVDEAWRAAL